MLSADYVLLYGGLQCGEPRTVTETRNKVQDQLRLACLGVERPISAAQTRTGVKDKVACYWIDKLIARSRLLKANRPGISAADLETDGMTWLRSQTRLPMNPLLDVPRKCSILYVQL